MTIAIDLIVTKMPDGVTASVRTMLSLVEMVEKSFVGMDIRRNDTRTKAKYYFLAKGRVKRATVFTENVSTEEEIRVSILRPVRVRIYMESDESTRRVAFGYAGVLSMMGAEYSIREEELSTGEIVGDGGETPAEFLWRIESLGGVLNESRIMRS